MPSISYFTNAFSRHGAAKTFSHGSLQSVVAVTHPSSYPNQHRNRLIHNPSVATRTAYPLQNAFHTSATASEAAAAVQDVRDVRHERVTTDQGGLEAYFDAWDKTQENAVAEAEEGAISSQIQKRIEWKSPAPAVVEPRIAEKIALPAVSRVVFERSWSTSAIDVLKSVEDTTKTIEVASYQTQDVPLAEFEHAALAEIDAKLEKELHVRATLDELDERVPTPSNAVLQSPALSIRSLAEDAAVTPASSVSPVSGAQAHKFAAHMTQLAIERRYLEIPAVFQAMLVGGITPTVQAYTALLDSIINFSTDLKTSVPKALDLYSDMLRRKVVPSVEIYGKLMSLIASRSIEISSLKKNLEVRRARYGGMEEAGKFMFASSELDYEILCEDDRLSVAIDMFKKATSSSNRVFSSQTYNNLVAACAADARIPEMTRLLEHMDDNQVRPSSATISAVILSLTQNAKDLVGAVERYNDYKELAIADDAGTASIEDRNDSVVYAAVVQSYVISNKVAGATQFFEKIAAVTEDQQVNNAIMAFGLVDGHLHRQSFSEAIEWAERIQTPQVRSSAFSRIATTSADVNRLDIATRAFNQLPLTFGAISGPAKAMLAMSARNGDVNAASHYWAILNQLTVDSSFIEATTIYTIALIGTGQVVDGLNQMENMFGRISATAVTFESQADTSLQIEEAVQKVQQFMAARNISDPRPSLALAQANQLAALAQQEQFENYHDPFAKTIDARGSAQIVEELERGTAGRFKQSRLNEALARLRGMRSLKRHPKYATYAKLIMAAAADQRLDLVNEIYALAQIDMPIHGNMQYATVRQGWTSILDAMVGACLTLGKRDLAGQYHQQLLDMGSAPSANTFGLYITTLKDSTKILDEATEAVAIFQRAKKEGVEPSSFLYNALIGKLGKARRIDDCLQYFNEMRGLGVQPTSVTYGTIVNALCRVSNGQLAEELFNEMENMPNYKARTAPYNSMMQFFLTTKHDKSKVLEYYERMRSRNIAASSHTYKLLIDAHATLEPLDMPVAESVLELMKSKGQAPEAVHYASLIHAHGCVLHDLPTALSLFDSTFSNPSIPPSACLYQSIFESIVANHSTSSITPLLSRMKSQNVQLTPYIANTLIKGWSIAGDLSKATEIYEELGVRRREPSTYEAMVRAYVAAGKKEEARAVVGEMRSQGYPVAVEAKVVELLG